MKTDINKEPAYEVLNGKRFYFDYFTAKQNATYENGCTVIRWKKNISSYIEERR